MTLNEAQVQKLLERNVTLRVKVLAFKAQLVFLEWDPVMPGSIWDADNWRLIRVPPAIPPEGVYVEDAVFGTKYVVCMPDPKGQLHFTAADSHGGARFLGASGLPDPPPLPNLNLVFIVLGLMALAALAVYLSPLLGLIPKRVA